MFLVSPGPPIQKPFLLSAALKSKFGLRCFPGSFVIFFFFFLQGDGEAMPHVCAQQS